MVDLTNIRALTFDVFGTVVDWRAGVAREAEAILAPKLIATADLQRCHELGAALATGLMLGVF
jgi:FMN phosphatase YigB (HAD superfamily)